MPVAIAICMLLLQPRQMRTTLTPRAIVHDLVAEDIAIDAEVILARFALVSARLARAFGSFWAARAAVCDGIVGWWKWRQTAETLCRAQLPSPFPGDFDPIAEREEVMI